MTNEEILEKLNHKDGLIKTVEIHKAMEAARKDEANKYEQLEKQVVELLSVSGCMNVIEVIDKFKTQTNG